jgi:CRISPR-associated protein Cas1
MNDELPGSPSIEALDSGISPADSTAQRKRISKNIGTPPPELGDLVRSEDRLSFTYFEHCIVKRSDNAITVTDDTGTIHVPAAALSVLMLGPGTDVTHQAMTVIGENGATVIWVGERGVRMYAFGRPLTHSAALLQRQAALVSNTRTRLAVARQMYQMRFPNEDVSRYTMQQLRGREGARVRQVYRKYSEQTGVEWNKRTYDHEDFDAGSEINKALSAAHTCLYGIAHSVIVALGCSPGLGFVHVGHERSFVYDIADLYKAELSIPVAFKTAASEPEDIGMATRHNMRDAVYDLSLLSRITKDIKTLFGGDDAALPDSDVDHVGLWDEKCGEVAAGRSYDDEEFTQL